MIARRLQVLTARRRISNCQDDHGAQMCRVCGIMQHDPLVYKCKLVSRKRREQRMPAELQQRIVRAGRPEWWHIFAVPGDV